MNSETCLFCDISQKVKTSYVFWEDERHLATLTPFPNTYGFTVVMPKCHFGSDIFELPDEALLPLILASKVVSGILKNVLNVRRVGLVFEGYGVDHAHVKLIPMHGIDCEHWKKIESKSSERKFYESYPGFIASHDGPAMDSHALVRLQNALKEYSSMERTCR